MGLNTTFPPYSPYPPLPSRGGGDDVAEATATPQQDEKRELTEDEKFDLVLSVGEECHTPPELRNLIQKKPNFRLYDGFEPSGRMHIAQGIFKAVNVNKCTQAGGTFVFWVADWFALMNDKMGGDLQMIKVVGQYFIEVWKAAGMDMSKVEFRWASSDITGQADHYWSQALDIARRFTVTRVKKCCQIMGRLEDNLTAAQILYPIMQCCDIFFLNANICQLGVDQSKVNMLAREYCTSAGIKLKPIILSHHMLYGLKKGQAKMSKSDPDSAIFMEDSEEEVRRKIQQAYCPTKPDPADVKEEEERLKKERQEIKEGKRAEGPGKTPDLLKNPCLDYVEHILLSAPGSSLVVAGVRYDSFDVLKKEFLSGSVAEQDLKHGIIEEINRLLEPVRSHFKNDKHAKNVLEQVKLFKQQLKEAPPKPSKFKRMQPGCDGCALVVCPLPQQDFSLRDMVSTLRALESAVNDKTNKGKVVLWVPNWSAFVLSCLDGNKKAIEAAFTIMVETLRAVDSAIMDKVTVMYQSETILKDPDNYWISVINVGRRFQLSKIRAVNPEHEYAGQVISTMMHVGDVVGLSPASIHCVSEAELLHNLASEYCDMVKSVEGAVPGPKVVVVQSVPDLGLKTFVEGDAAKNDKDNEVFMNDLPADVKRKIKRAFCEPKNTDTCPPLLLAQHVVLPMLGCLSVPCKGGDGKEYKEGKKMMTDFAEDILRPQDLKPSVTKAVDSIVQRSRDRAAKNQDFKKAVTVMKNFVKQQSKKKDK